MLPLWDSHKLKRPGRVTRVLVGVNLVVFAVETLLIIFQPEMFERWFIEFALVPERWWSNRATAEGWGPVFSSMFLHGGFAHVVGNCWFLWVFGRSLEDHVGSMKFLLIYLATGVGAAVLQASMDLSSMVPMVGASGAISGVMGAYLVRLSGRWILTLIPWVVPIVPIPAIVFLVMWFGMQLFNGIGGLGLAGEGGVAWWAHVGGFVTGVVLGRWLGPTAKGGKRKKTT